MRKLSLLIICLVGIFCGTANGSGEKRDVCENDVPSCSDPWECTDYCVSVFTGTWLDVECNLDGCCECIDIG